MPSMYSKSDVSVVHVWASELQLAWVLRGFWGQMQAQLGCKCITVGGPAPKDGWHGQALPKERPVSSQRLPSVG